MIIISQIGNIPFMVVVEDLNKYNEIKEELHEHVNENLIYESLEDEVNLYSLKKFSRESIEDIRKAFFLNIIESYYVINNISYSYEINSLVCRNGSETNELDFDEDKSIEHLVSIIDRTYGLNMGVLFELIKDLYQLIIFKNKTLKK